MGLSFQKHLKMDSVKCCLGFFQAFPEKQKRQNMFEVVISPMKRHEILSMVTKKHVSNAFNCLVNDIYIYILTNTTIQYVVTHIYIFMGVSKNRGTPKWMVHNGKTLLKWMIWGYPYFWKQLYICLPKWIECTHPMVP